MKKKLANDRSYRAKQEMVIANRKVQLDQRMNGKIATTGTKSGHLVVTSSDGLRVGFACQIVLDSEFSVVWEVLVRVRYYLSVVTSHY